MAVEGVAQTETCLRQACLEMERRFSAGMDCSAEDFRELYPDLWQDAEAALELVFTEFVLRKERGEHDDPESWRKRFPQWRERLDRLFQVHELMEGHGRSLLRGADTRTSLVETLPQATQATPRGRRMGGYDLLEEIARGGMGVIYKARHVELHRMVALKMILAGDFAGPEARLRFRHEAEAAARLQHPNIVQIYEIGQEDNLPFLAMEYVNGPRLDEWVKQGHKGGSSALSPQDAAKLVECLGRAMHYAHEHGVVHRDLKPANILLQESVVSNEESPAAQPSTLIPDFRSLIPKIVDFGLAKTLDHAGTRTHTGAILGTPSYMAPEQAAGKGAGPAADVYALGMILYELLTGRLPFDGATLEETLEQVRTVEPAPPRQFRPTLSPDLQTICLTCLQKEPSQRYGSALRLADDLARFLRDEPIRARPVGRLERTWRWCRRNPVVAGLTIGIALVLLVGMAAASGLAVWALSEKNQATKNAEQERLARQLADERLDQAEQAVKQYLHGIDQNPRLRDPAFNDLRRHLISSAIPFYEDFVKQRPGDPTMEAKRGKAYTRLGMLRHEIKEPEQAIGAYAQAESIFRKLIADFPMVAEHRVELARVHDLVGRLHGARARWDDAETELCKAVAVNEQLITDFPNEPGHYVKLAMNHDIRAIFLSHRERFLEAELAQRASVTVYQRLVARFPDVPKYRSSLAGEHRRLAKLLLRSGKKAEVERQFVQAVHVTSELLDQSRGSANSLAAALDDLCAFLNKEGRPDEARRHIEPVIDQLRQSIQEVAEGKGSTAGERNPYRAFQRLFFLTKDHVALADAARRSANHRSANVNDAKLAAQYLCQCIGFVARYDKGPEPERHRLIQAYGDQAMEHLRTAMARGFKDAASLQKQEYAPLRTRPDFKQLLAEMAAK